MSSTSGRIAAERRIGVDQIDHLVGRQRQAEALVGGRQRGAAVGAERDTPQRPRRFPVEEARRLAGAIEHRFGHAIVQRAGQRRLVGHLAPHRVADAALDPPHAQQATAVRDVGGLGRPGGDGAEARHDEEPPPRSHRLAPDALGRLQRPVAQQLFQQPRLVGRERPVHVGEVEVRARQRAHRRVGPANRGQALLQTGGDQRGAADNLHQAPRLHPQAGARRSEGCRRAGSRRSPGACRCGPSCAARASCRPDRSRAP